MGEELDVGVEKIGNEGQEREYLAMYTSGSQLSRQQNSCRKFDDPCVSRVADLWRSIEVGGRRIRLNQPLDGNLESWLDGICTCLACRQLLPRGCVDCWLISKTRSEE